MNKEDSGVACDVSSDTPSVGLLSCASSRVALVVAVSVALAGCSGSDTRATRLSGEPETPQSDPSFTLDYCGICPRDPNMDFGSDFSQGFLEEGESCTYAPYQLVDGDPQTGWAEGGVGQGVGAEVVIPQRLDLDRPVRIWAGYGKSPDLFEANARPKRVRVTVLRLRLRRDPDAHDATGCSFATYVEPVEVAEHEVALEDFNGYQTLPVPEFEVEHYDEYPMEWLMMDGTERYLHQQRVDAAEASPYEPEPWEYAYLLKLTLLEVYPGTRYDDTVISEIGNVQLGATPTLSADEAELWEGTWDEESWMSDGPDIRFRLEIHASNELGFQYQSEYQDVPYGPNAIRSAVHTAQFAGPRRAMDPATGHVFLLTVNSTDPGARVIDVVEGNPGTLRWSPAEAIGPETLEGRWILDRPVFQAGFDCEGATSPVETTICGIELLARGDLEMNSLYGDLMRSITPDQEQSLRASQRAFLTSRDGNCSNDGGVDERCLARFYADRLVALERLQEPSLGVGPRFDADYVKSTLERGVDLRRNMAARLAMYPLDMEDGTTEWHADGSGILYEQSYIDTRVVWPADIEILYSDMFFVGSGGEVVAAAHMIPADSVSYSGLNAEYGFDPLRIELDAGRPFLTIWREQTGTVPDLVRDWLDRHPTPDLEAWE